MGGSLSSEEGDISGDNRRICGICSNDEETQALLGDPENDAPEIQSSDRHAEGGEGHGCIVQFSCAIYFVCENEGKVVLDIVRFGDASKKCSCDYFTVDSSAKKKIKYTETKGTVFFEPGETQKNISIGLIDNQLWDATLEFACQLANSRGAQLGMYLKECRIKIIDDDAFPTNLYKGYYAREGAAEDGLLRFAPDGISYSYPEFLEYFGAEEGDRLWTSALPEEVPAFGIFKEFCKMNMTLPPVARGVVKSMLLDQIKNLYFFLTLYLQMYLVDVVLSKKKEGEGGEGSEPSEEGEERRRLLFRCLTSAGALLSRSWRRLGEEGEEKEGEGELSLVPEVLLVPGDRTATAILVGIFYIAPFILLHLSDIRKLKFNVAGISRLHLQTNLMRKFLNYKEDHRSKISVGDVTMTMVRDVSEVVNFGFMKVLEVIRIVGKLMLALIFILTENRMAVLPLFVYPVVMALFLYCRGEITIERAEEMAQKQNDVVATASEAVQNYRLIADFNLRPLMVDTYEKEVQAFNACQMASTVVYTHNVYLPPWLTTVLIGVYMGTGPFQVNSFGGPLSLGAFLATINIFKEVGFELAEIYKEFMEIQKACGPLRKIARFMNLETDLRERMAINRMRRERGHEKRLAVRNLRQTETNNSIVRTDDGSHVFAVDMVSIDLENVTYSYEGNTVLQNVNVSFPQGKLYAFVGPPHQGKATLLKIMGQVLLVDPERNGMVFVPPHLRVLHVNEEAYFLSHTLLKNIIFHMDLKKIGGMSRIRRICERLKFPERLLRVILDEKDARSMDERAQSYRNFLPLLSHTDLVRVNLARALIMNPECMILHKPSLRFDDVEAKEVIQLLRSHVDEKGLELPAEGRKSRRMRTVFFTAASTTGIDLADVIYEVSQDNGVLRVSEDKFVRPTL